MFAIGSRRITPTVPVIAAVVSEPIVAPRYTPWVQLNDCRTSGTVVERRPPKRIAEIGTPFGSSTKRDRAGLFFIGAVNRLFGCAAYSAEPFVHGRPRQSVSRSGTSPSMPSHQTSPSGVSATFVKYAFRSSDRIAFGFVW